MVTRSKKISLKVKIGGLALKNPVMSASGTFGYGEEYNSLVDLNRLGAIVVKGISLEPWPGNPTPRIAETTAGMLNAIGLQNVGVEGFVEEKLPFLRQFEVPVVVNFLGKSLKEYVAVARKLEEVEGIAALEMNVSCPNVKAGGLVFGTDPKRVKEVVKAVRKEWSSLLIVKLTPNVTDIGAIARSAEEAGADAISLINTVRGMAIDINERKPKLATVVGGLSGPAIKPIALRMVWETVQAVEIPVIGIGGITTAEDALEFLIAGARAVQVGTANFINPLAMMEIIQGLERYLEIHGMTDFRELIGSLKTS